MKILGYVRDVEIIELPRPVIVSLSNYLQILDENYGANRSIYRDLGGYAIIAESDSDIVKIKNEIIKGIIPEDVEVIECGEGQVYCSSLFILSSDYAVIVIATKELTDILLEE